MQALGAAFALGMGTSWGQGVDSIAADPVEMDPVTVVLEVPETREYAAAWHWERAEPHLPHTRVFVALSSPGPDSEQVMALDGAGAVWRSFDGGAAWQRVLPPLSASALDTGMDDEALLLQAEGISEPFPEGDDFESMGGDSEEELLEAQGIIRDELDDAMSIQQLLDTDATGPAPERIGSLSHDPMGWMNVLLGRLDGIWRSQDGGRSFQQVHSGVHAAGFAWAEDGIVAAATHKGVYLSLDGGESWAPVAGISTDLVVHDLVYDWDAGWFAATDGGLLTSPDGIRWRFARATSALAGQEVLAISVDSDSIWAATENTVLRSDDGGTTFVPVTRQHLPQTRRLLRTLTPGQLLAVGADGVWETLDGGFRWRPVSAGLRGPSTWDLAWADDTLFLAGESGLYKLARDLASDEAAFAEKPARVIPALAPLVDAALHRSGVDPRQAGLKPERNAMGRILPELGLDFQLVDRENLSVDCVNRTNAMDTDWDWRAMVVLQWGRGANASTADSALENASFSDLYYTMRGELFQADDSGSVRAAASALTSESTAYRVDLGEQVARLYYSRERVARILDGGPTGDIRRDPQRTLDLQELTAWIDAYTEGAMSRALVGDPTRRTE